MPNAFSQNKIFTATDLNRRSGYVLDEARLHPVTILRNERAFTLLPIEHASRLAESAEHAATMVELAVTVSNYRQAGKAVPAGHAFEWLNSFDQDDLRKMLDEIAAAFRGALGGETGWDEFEEAIHRWKESAPSAGSGEAAVAFTVPAENSTLTAPNPAEPAVITADLKAAASEADGARSPAEVESEPESEPVQRRPLPRAWRTGSQTFFRVRRY